MFFPEKYNKPVLQNIVEASQNGWNATCSGGVTPGTAGYFCGRGDGAGAKGDFNGFIYVNPNRSQHTLDPEDVGEGL